jgi:hypothetical protein
MEDLKLELEENDIVLSYIENYVALSDIYRFYNINYRAGTIH